MRLSLDWLSEHVDLEGLTPEQVSETYTLHVAAVDELIVPGGGWPGVHVGRVKAVRPHPNADKLRLVTVDAGPPLGVHEVVCGAPNVAEGQKICFAPEGTTLPDGLVLKRRKIRGVESAGMVLSERELGLADEHEGILVLDATAPVGAPVTDVLPGGAVLDVDNTAITTRPDLWGHYGAARELAAVLGRPLRPLACGAVFPDAASEVRVAVEVPALCPRYLGWRIGGLRVAPSPGWLRHRLQQAGQRPVNNVVDLTNYVSLECGQPMHAFDTRQIAEGLIVVRAATRDEAVVTLDGVERRVPEGACLIADARRAVAVAGVMGLANSEVARDTTEIVLEVANFEMRSIRATAQALGLRTESAVRFEKGLDPEGVPVAARRFLHLLRGLCPDAAPIGGPCDVRVAPDPRRPVVLDEGFVGRRLGTAIAPSRVDDILGRLGFGVKRSGSRLAVTAPSWRSERDISIPEDIVEEIGRIHGYDKITPVALHGDLQPVHDEPAREARRVARRALSRECGLTEIHLYPFTTAAACERAGVEPGTLQLANAEQPGLDLMSTSQVPGILRAAAENLKYREESCVYCIGPVFLEGEPGQLPRENERIAIAIARRGGASPALAAKGAVEAVVDAFRIGGARTVQEEGPAWLHPGRAARVARGRDTFGWFGEVHPRVVRAFLEVDGSVALADLDLDGLRAAEGRAARMQPVGRYPTVPYDVAVVVDRRTPVGDVEAALRSVDRDLVRDVRFFDEYVGKSIGAGKRSLAFSLVFGSLERTLDGSDVERLREAVQRNIAKKGWALRD